MIKIRRDDIQRVGDETTLLHFLEEKLNLPISGETTLAQIALPLPLPFLGLDDALAEQIIDCQDFSGFSQDDLGERRPFLIRFRHQSGYVELLRQIAENLHQKNTNPAKLFFICADEHFQPFALAYFNNTKLKDWQTAVLNILAWTQDNTHIHTSSEHELPTDFFPNKLSEDSDDGSDIFGEEFLSFADADYNELGDSTEDNTEIGREDALDEENIISNELEDNIETATLGNQNRASAEVIIKHTSPESLFNKLESIGAPLSHCGKIYSGILTGHNEAFVIDESKREQLIEEDIASSELIKPLLMLGQKWKTGLTYIIWIPSSQNRYWPWSEIENESEAKRIFEQVFPAISAHLNLYENQLKRRSHQGKFYWEFTSSSLCSMPKHSKIVYPNTGTSMQAAYDTSEAFPLFPGRFIPTEDLSLIAILNSRLFDWYVQTYRTSQLNNISNFKNAFMKDIPIAVRTNAQKAEISQLVQQILAAPDSPAVPDFEKKIDTLVYELYELTDAEITLITEDQQPSYTSQDSKIPLETSTVAQQINQDERQTQTDADHLLAVLQNTEPQQTISPSNPIPEEKTTNWSTVPVSSENLLVKLKNIGIPLGQHWNIYTGITPGCVEALVIDEAKSRQMISVDPRNSEFIEPLALALKANRWKPESAYLIWISSSDYNRWPWSNTENESEAERIFEDTYPVLSQHLISYRNILKSRTSRHQGKFYWELSLREPKHENYTVFYQPKIIYPIHSSSMRALYDTSESIILGSSYCIPTDDLSLLAILNSTLFDWYAQFKCRGPREGNSLLFTQENMVNVPIAPRTSTQRSEISHLVQQILDAPNSPNIPNLEEEINMLVYDLYNLTPAEIALIEEESNQ